MKKNKEIENLLLNSSTFDELVNAKLEKEFIDSLGNNKQIKSKKYITNIKEVPRDKIFSKDAVYSVINKDSRTKSYINGLQAEGCLGVQNLVRAKLLAGQVDSFVSENSLVKFVKVKV